MFSQSTRCWPKLNTLFLSSLTETTDLTGGIEPHTKDSFLLYLRNYCAMLIAEHEDVASVQALKDKLRNDDTWRETIGQVLTQLETKGRTKKWQNHVAELNKLLKAFSDDGQQFPFCERGATVSARFGGVLFLKDFNLQPTHFMI